jgi:rubrerythrin
MSPIRQRAGKSAELLDALNQALRLEYSLVVSYPRLAKKLADNTIRETVDALARASLVRAGRIAALLGLMGESPLWTFEAVTDEMEVNDLFLRYQGLEDRSTKMQRRCAELALDEGLKSEFLNLADENQAHARELEKIARASRFGSPLAPALLGNLVGS